MCGFYLFTRPPEASAESWRHGKAPAAHPWQFSCGEKTSLHASAGAAFIVITDWENVSNFPSCFSVIVVVTLFSGEMLLLLHIHFSPVDGWLHWSTGVCWKKRRKTLRMKQIIIFPDTTLCWFPRVVFFHHHLIHLLRKCCASQKITLFVWNARFHHVQPFQL